MNDLLFLIASKDSAMAGVTFRLLPVSTGQSSNEYISHKCVKDISKNETD